MRTTLTRVLVATIMMVGSVAMMAAPAYADSRTQYTNGCTIVPDVTPYGDFTRSCNLHDICYARYSNGLHQYGEHEGGRAFCDNEFLGRMYNVCEARPWREEPACFANALAYYNGVRLLGVPFYYDYNTLW